MDAVSNLQREDAKVRGEEAVALRESARGGIEHNINQSIRAMKDEENI